MHSLPFLFIYSFVNWTSHVFGIPSWSFQQPLCIGFNFFFKFFKFLYFYTLNLHFCWFHFMISNNNNLHVFIPFFNKFTWLCTLCRIPLVALQSESSVLCDGIQCPDAESGLSVAISAPDHVIAGFKRSLATVRAGPLQSCQVRALNFYSIHSKAFLMTVFATLESRQWRKLTPFPLTFSSLSSNTCCKRFSILIYLFHLIRRSLSTFTEAAIRSCKWLAFLHFILSLCQAFLMRK